MSFAVIETNDNSMVQDLPYTVNVLKQPSQVPLIYAR